MQPSNLIYLSLAVSIASGGLSGGLVSTLFNRFAYWRQLRTKFHPKLNNIFAVYMIRMDNDSRQCYWTTTVDVGPDPLDVDFVDQREAFLMSLVEFNELKEARVLRQVFLTNIGNYSGNKCTVDLMPEMKAIEKCFTTVEKKLRIITRAKTSS